MSTSFTFRIQLCGVSAAFASISGKANKSSGSSFSHGVVFPSGGSIPSSVGAQHKSRVDDTPTQSMSSSSSLPGDNRKPRPTICVYKASDCVGRAIITVSTSGMSVPSVKTMQFTMHGISRRVKAAIISERFLVSPVTTTAPGMRFAISSQHSTDAAKISVAPFANCLYA